MTFRFRPDYNLPLRLRVIESYQYQAFSPSAMESFYRSEFIVTPNSDRMGYRLQGETISPPDQAILSEGIALGAIQVPPNGQPIILLNDRQTIGGIGGYPKLGCVARIDLPRLAQAKPGHSVRFVAGDGLQAVWCQWARFFGY
ncbi:allophanate hydrolase 2 subunit 2 [Vibrio cholerae]|nr:allophanate hydrolase 2 subunit 2 [Vibrio cholerae]